MAVGLPQIERRGLAIARDDFQRFVGERREIGCLARIVVRQPLQLARVGAEDVGDVARQAIAHLDPDRVDEDQPRDAGGRFDGDLRRDPAAHRETDQRHVAQIERVEQIEIEIRQIVDAVDPIGQFRGAESRMRRRDDAPVLGEQAQERRLRLQAARTMQHEDRRPFADVEIRQRNPRCEQLFWCHDAHFAPFGEPATTQSPFGLSQRSTSTLSAVKPR